MDLDVEAMAKEIAPVVKSYVTQAIAPLLARIAELEAREVINGKDGAPGEQGLQGERGERGERGEAGAEGPRGQAGEKGDSGESVTPEDLAPLIAEAAASAIKAEKDAIIVAAAEQAAALVPVPKNGTDGSPGEPGPKGEKGDPGERGSDGPRGEKGDAGPTGEKGDPGAVGEKGERGLVGPEGIAGRDGRDGLPGVQGEKGLDGKDGTDGRNGTDGIGFDDLSVEFDGDRTATIKFARGAQVREFPLVLPLVVDKGVFSTERKYAKGDATTFGGSLWVAQRDAEGERPGEGNDAWRLAVKRGRDGKDFSPQAERKRTPIKVG